MGLVGVVRRLPGLSASLDLASRYMVDATSGGAGAAISLQPAALALA